MSAQPKLTGLSRKLVNDGVLEEASVVEAIAKAREDKVSLTHYLVSNKLVPAKKIAIEISLEFGLPVMDLDSFDIGEIPEDLFDDKLKKLVKQHHALPIYKRGNRLYVAISDPANLSAVDDIKFATSTNVEAVLTEHDKLTKMIEDSLEEKDEAFDYDDGDDEFDEDAEIIDTDAKDDGDESNIDDTPVVKFINGMLFSAIKMGASDLHFEPYEKRYRVRFRVDGMLKEIKSPPVSWERKISARVKVMSKLDTSERRVPQDGRIKLKISKKKSIDFRVSTCPTLFGEKVVMRILDSDSAKLGIDMLGYEPEQKQLYLDALANPYGMILVTGPTGSGKTVSLYTGLNILNTEGTNINTAEDPVEINLEGINQVNVNPKVGLDFDAALKSFLRQDPDIIMVGEIRDLGTASIAVKAAQTGHMVMSTLHTNDAPQTIARLMNMGVPPFNLATALNLIIAQRLGRRLCEKCKTVEDVPNEVLVEEGFTEEQIKEGITLYKAVGCDACAEGYKGRVGIYQVMPVTEDMGKIIMAEGSAYDIADQAQKEGINDIRQSALLKAIQGVTSLTEINRVTME